MILDIVIIFFILFMGSALQGVSGFGFGLFSMSFLPFLFTLKQSSLLVIALSLIVAAIVLLKSWRSLDKNVLLYILAAALLGRLSAFFILTNYGDESFLRQFLGFILIGMVAYLLLNKRPTNPKLANSKWLPLLLGYSGGVVGGVFAVGGPFFVFYLLLVCKDKYAYTANLQATFVITALVTVTLHAVNGDLGGNFWLYFLFGAMAVSLGTRVGMYWFDRVSQERVKQIAGCIVALSGINMIFFS
ncbi:sulfite exporter TauE/SafE family protein [Shouchella shacheensis]|uniref:sulfite exporter TauE/SafE family protein n=1 Tax=Shouchella shacheensis TaxID=1649580 RepID=UPI00073FD3FF|nr:sulfite exporter TauE/SafE family protein [Shouchella shacheensis]